MGAESLRQETEVSDSDEALRQYMQEEPAQELRRQQRHLALFAAVSIVLPTEGDVLTIECLQPMIGDGDPMRITSQIAQDFRRPAEGWFGIDYPVLAVQPA